MINIINKILENKDIILAETIKNLTRSDIYKGPDRQSFIEAIRGQKHIIAEVKKASPSTGELTTATHLEIASIYNKTNISAMSILTQPQYFKGSINDLLDIANLSDKPLLRKEFIFSKEQILEAKLFGASAVLLMTDIIKNESKLIDFIIYTESLGIDALVEVQTAEDIAMAIRGNSKIIGINARDLKTLIIDTDKFLKMYHLIPDNIVKIAASGIETANDMRKFNMYDAFLIGSSITRNGLDKINDKVNEFMDV